MSAGAGNDRASAFSALRYAACYRNRPEEHAAMAGVYLLNAVLDGRRAAFWRALADTHWEDAADAERREAGARARRNS